MATSDSGRDALLATKRAVEAGECPTDANHTTTTEHGLLRCLDCGRSFHE